MAEVAVKAPAEKKPMLAALKELPRPTRWDLISIAVLAAGVVLAGANLSIAHSRPPGESFPQGLTTLFVFTHLAISLAGLMLLGKTAKEGTWWGNLAALGATFVGMGGLLLAGALWAAY